MASVAEKCGACGATLRWTDCRRCDGTGEVEDDDPINGPEVVRCPDCHGRGEYRCCEFCDEDD